MQRSATLELCPEKTGEQQNVPPAPPARAPSGRFQKGASGNPHGRPPGSRNKTTLLYQDLLASAGPEVMEKAIALAKKGHKVALRLVLERLLPPARSGAAAIDLPGSPKPPTSPKPRAKCSPQRPAAI